MTALLEISTAESLMTAVLETSAAVSNK